MCASSWGARRADIQELVQVSENDLDLIWLSCPVSRETRLAFTRGDLERRTGSAQLAVDFPSVLSIEIHDVAETLALHGRRDCSGG
jgi:hypothetical protein